MTTAYIAWSTEDGRLIFDGGSWTGMRLELRVEFQGRRRFALSQHHGIWR